jgi:hypothetical protein
LAIKSNAHKVIFIRNFQQLVKAYVENFEKATDSCYRSLQDKQLIIESFNDAAYPFGRTEDCNVVLCVSSSVVLSLPHLRVHEGIGRRLLATVLSFQGNCCQRKYHRSDNGDPRELWHARVA